MYDQCDVLTCVVSEDLSISIPLGKTGPKNNIDVRLTDPQAMDVLYLPYLGWSSVSSIVLSRSRDIPSSVSISPTVDTMMLMVSDC